MNFLEQELEKRKLPSLMTLSDGSQVQTAQDWEIRRGEIETILSRDFLGYAVRLRVKTTCETVRVEEHSYGGKAVTEYRELHVRSDFSEGMFPFTLTLPEGVKRFPSFCSSPLPTKLQGASEKKFWIRDMALPMYVIRTLQRIIMMNIRQGLAGSVPEILMTAGEN